MSATASHEPLLADVESGDFPRLLAAADAGDAGAWSRIYALLYPDLHRIARSQIRRQTRAQLSPTSLISETWPKLSAARLNVSSRRHLTSLIARAMRFVLIDETRRALAHARADSEHAPAADAATDMATQVRLERLLSINRAMDGLATVAPRLARVVELRYFGGLSEPEVADVLAVTERTVSRDWRKARAWLMTYLGEQAGTSDF